jgi:hypothetical protein
MIAGLQYQFECHNLVLLNARHQPPICSVAEDVAENGLDAWRCYTAALAVG